MVCTDIGDDDGIERDSSVLGTPEPLSDETGQSAEDVAIGQAKRMAACDRIQEIRRSSQERIDRMFAEYLADHGEETETSAEDFLRETDGPDGDEAGKG